MRTKELGSEILLIWVCTKWCALNQDIYGNNVLVSNKMPSYEENYKKLLVTCMIIIKLRHCI